MLLKVCGITRREDLEAVARIGADYAGFILAEGSPRRVKEERAQALLERCRALGMKGVLVVRDLPLESLQGLLGRLKPDVVQLHGSESPEYASFLMGVEVWKAFRLLDDRALEEAVHFPAQVALADSGGGTGRPCSWPLARELSARRRIFLAGGLNPGNLREAICQVRPDGVDLSSGVESAPGIKSLTKLQQLGECLK